MAGYIPESTKEVQAMIVKSYADTVLNAFLLSPELLSVAPAGRKADIEDQLSILEELQKATFVDRQRIALLCDISAIESEIVLRYLRKRSLKEEDIKWLEDKIKMQESAVNMIPDPSVSEMYKSALTGLSELLEDVKTKGVALRSAEMKLNIKENKFIFGGQEWKFDSKSPFLSFFSFLYSLPESYDPADISELQRRQYEISQIGDVAKYAYSILESLGKKAQQLNVSSVFTSIVMPSAYKKKAEISFQKGKTPKPMYKPIVLSGPPGVGKTAILREIASWTNTNLFSFSMAQMDASSFGFPVYDPATGSAKRDILDDMKNTVKRPGVVLLDEMNRTNADMQSKLLTYLLDHKVSGFTVHPLSLVVGAENPVSSDPYGTMIKSIAMIDRCTYIDMSNYEMIVKGWFEWLEEEYAIILQEDDLLRSFVKFLKEDPPLGARDIILNIPKNPENDPSFPTPRSIDSAILAIALSHGDFNTAMVELRANVGNEMANRFASYMDIIRSLPKPEELVEKSKDVLSILAAIAVDSKITISDVPQVTGFQKGLFNSINGYDDGERKDVKKRIIDSYTGKNLQETEMFEFISTLTPEKAKTMVEEITKDLYFSGGVNLFEIGAASEMADILVHNFQKSLRNSLDNDEPIDGVYLNGLFKAACFFPVPTTRSYILNQMERSVMLAPWAEDFKEKNEIAKKICKSKVKTHKGVIDIDEDIVVRAFFKIISAAPWLSRVSKVFKESLQDVTSLLKEAGEADHEIEIA